MAFSTEVKERAYAIDPECWVSYSGHPRQYKQAMEYRRTVSLNQAQKEADDTSMAAAREAMVGRNPRMESFIRSRIATLREELTMYSFAADKTLDEYPLNTLHALVDARQNELDALTAVYESMK